MINFLLFFSIRYWFAARMNIYLLSLLLYFFHLSIYIYLFFFCVKDSLFYLCYRCRRSIDNIQIKWKNIVTQRKINLNNLSVLLGSTTHVSISVYFFVPLAVHAAVFSLSVSGPRRILSSSICFLRVYMIRSYRELLNYFLKFLFYLCVSFAKENFDGFSVLFGFAFLLLFHIVVSVFLAAHLYVLYINSKIVFRLFLHTE